MKKKIIVAALVGIVGTQTHAAAPHTGFSVGANVGVTNVDGKLKRTFTTPADDNSNLGARSPVVGLFLGYGWSPNSYGVYLGGEIFAQYENTRASREDLNQFLGWKTRLETNNTFGAVAKLGYVCKEALFYLKAGVASTKMRFNFTTPDINLNKSQRKTGFITGVGIDYAIAKNWALGAEYLYAIYGALKLAGTDAGGTNITLNHKPRVSTFNLRLKYAF